MCALRCWSPSGAGTCGSSNGVDVRLPEFDVDACARSASPRSTTTTSCRAATSSAIDLRLAGPRDGAAVRRRRPGARRSRQEKAAEDQGRQRMSPLNYGLTPKMKPVAPKRTALVAALDVGTSKIACLIGRLKPQPPQDVLRRRSHAIEVIGFSHTESLGMKAGHVVDLVEAEEAVRHAVDLAERSAKCQIESVIVSMSAGRLAERAADRRDRGLRARRSAIATSPACSPRAAGSRPATAASCCIRCRSAIRSTTPTACAIRAACWRRASASTCMWSPPTRAPARNLMLAVERCHLADRGHGGRPLCGEPRDARRRRGRSRRRRHRHGRRHHHAWRYSRMDGSSMPTALRSAAGT